MTTVKSANQNIPRTNALPGTKIALFVKSFDILLAAKPTGRKEKGKSRLGRVNHDESSEDSTDEDQDTTHFIYGWPGIRRGAGWLRAPTRFLGKLHMTNDQRGERLQVGKSQMRRKEDGIFHVYRKQIHYFPPEEYSASTILRG